MLPTRREGVRQPREIKKFHANIEIGGAGRWAVHGCLSTCDLFCSRRVCHDVEIICPSTIALRVYGSDVYARSLASTLRPIYLPGREAEEAGWGWGLGGNRGNRGNQSMETTQKQTETMETGEL